MPQYDIQATVNTSAYAAGDVLDDFVLPGAIAREILLTDITVYDAAGQDAEIDFFFFSGALAGTYTTNAAFAIDSSDLSKLRCVITVSASDYKAAGTPSVATKTPSPITIRPLVTDSDLSVVAVTRGTPTYSAATDLQFIFGAI